MSDYKDYGFYVSDPAHTFSYLQQPILSLLDKSKNKCILDLGCGNGYLANLLLKMGYNAFGTDASTEGIAIARETSPDRFFLQDLSTGKLPDELQGQQFDTIISTEVIEHLYDPEGFINFCKQQLAGSGEIIITTPYHGYLKNLALSLFNKWDTHMDPMWHGGHIKMWSRKTLSKALTDAGFSNVEFIGCGRVPYFYKSMILKARLN
ncbi:class I SAM-dependent methyltransferase [Mucilaginibacter corticis]|uniref:Class I SAM-dependent methyltransferase n=1 Tax=Mucilaginibacter corticis TaxID=2597670 RepID=A0A556MF51_9SPHI|nr:class I SAM-dependent methyltransferase [Mucilaginibacter corticis]TSJ38527.1 class I SAM-dependent methyltransferase [Mucilaginibacter corticis]